MEKIMEMKKLVKNISPYDIHMPVGMVGMTLTISEKAKYEMIMESVQSAYASANATLEQQAYFNVSETINLVHRHLVHSSVHPDEKFCRILKCVLERLRINMLSPMPGIVNSTIHIIDSTYKNTSNIVQDCIGNRRFMKTLRMIAKRHLQSALPSWNVVGCDIVIIMRSWQEMSDPQRNRSSTLTTNDNDASSWLSYDYLPSAADSPPGDETISLHSPASHHPESSVANIPARAETRDDVHISGPLSLRAVQAKTGTLLEVSRLGGVIIIPTDAAISPVYPRNDVNSVGYESHEAPGLVDNMSYQRVEPAHHAPVMAGDECTCVINNDAFKSLADEMLCAMRVQAHTKRIFLTSSNVSAHQKGDTIDASSTNRDEFTSQANEAKTKKISQPNHQGSPREEHECDEIPQLHHHLTRCSAEKGIDLSASSDTDTIPVVYRGESEVPVKITADSAPGWVATASEERVSTEAGHNGYASRYTAELPTVNVSDEQQSEVSATNERHPSPKRSPPRSSVPHPSSDRSLQFQFYGTHRVAVRKAL
jgi:hypothetical protein